MQALIDCDRVRIDDGTEVMSLLRRSADDGALCSVRAAGRAESYLSTLRELGDDGAPTFDPPPVPVIERALVPGSVAAIDVRLRDGRVSFEARVDHVGSRQLRLARPSALTRLHRREMVRVRVPSGLRLALTLDPDEPLLRDMAMAEVCVSGGSLEVRGLRQRMDVGRVFARASLSLPAGQVWTVTVRVSHAGALRMVGATRELRLGVQFVQPPDGFELALAQVVGEIARQPVGNAGV
jgi:hypothetical protein